MKATRRSVLTTGAAMLALLAGGPRVARAQAGPRSLVVCLTGIDARTPPMALQQAAALFLSRGLPVTVALDLPATPDAPVFRTAADLARREPGLFEIAVLADPAVDSWRYFQMRAAAGLRDRLHAFHRATGAGLPAPPVVTVVSRPGDQPIDLAAFRSAGFLALVRPGAADCGTCFAASGAEQISLAGGVAASGRRPPRLPG